MSQVWVHFCLHPYYLIYLVIITLHYLFIPVHAEHQP
jgi:hypothetical protein